MNTINLKLDDLVKIENKPNPVTTTSPLTIDTSTTLLHGEIAYIGPVSFADGDDWVGVRLIGDSIGHGKNDGSVRGLRYFKRCGLNGGIFVRAERVKALTTNQLEDGSGVRPRSERYLVSSAGSGTTGPPRHSTGSKVTKYNESTSASKRPKSQSSSLSSSSNGKQQRMIEKVQEKINKLQQSHQSAKQLARDTNNVNTTTTTITSALESEILNTKVELKNIPNCIHDLSAKLSHLTTTLTSTQTTIAGITKDLDITVVTVNSELSSAQKRIALLENQLISSTTILAQRDETIAAHCKQSTRFQSEIVTLKGKVEELVGEKEGLNVSINKMTLDKEGMEKQLKEVELDRESANIKVGELRLELVGVRESVTFTEALAEVEGSAGDNGLIAVDIGIMTVDKKEVSESGVAHDVYNSNANASNETNSEERAKDATTSTMKTLEPNAKQLAAVKIAETATFEEETSKSGANNDGGVDGDTNNMEAILCIGNPGTGKSTLLNSTMGTVKFNSGFSLGIGKTNEMEKHECDGIFYIDTPGLADPTLREQSANAINQALREKMKIKILFVMTLEDGDGHVRQQDQLTLRLVLEAMHGEIEENQYGIIINKVPPVCDACKRSFIDNNKIAEELFFGSEMPQSNRIFQLPVNMEITEADDALLVLPKEYSDFLENLRPVQINSEILTDIDWNRYETLQKKIKETEDACEIMKRENDSLKQELNEGEEDVGEEGEGEEDEGKEDEEEENKGEEHEYGTVKRTSNKNLKEVFHLKPNDHIIVHNEVKVKQDTIPVDTLGKVVSTGNDDVTIIFKDYNNNRPIQVPKRNCNDIYTNDYVVKETCSSLTKRGISLGDLLKFYHKLSDPLHKEFNPEEDTTKDVADAAIIPQTKKCNFNPEKHTTYDVAQAVIIPQTKTFGEAYTNCITKSKLASRMVSHTWGNKFRHLVAAIVADAMGIPRYGDLVTQLSRDNLPHLRKELKEKKKLGIVYWVCAFSINQHSIEKSDENGYPIYEVGRYGNGHPKCEVDKFDGMFNELVNKTTSSGRSAHHVVAIDQLSTIFSRAWVIAEMVQADIIQDNPTTKMKQTFCAFDEESLEPLIQNEVDIKECKAHRPEDKEMILAKAETYYEFHVINRKMNDRIAELVDETKVAIKEEKRIRVLLIGNKGVGKTTLLKAMTGNAAIEHGEHEHEYNGMVFMELSGLANARALKQVSIAITAALNKGGMYKIFFIVTAEGGGRVRTDDTETISSVLKAAPIKGNYTIIVNKASPRLRRALINDKEKNVFLQALLPNEPIGHIKCIKCIPESNCKDEVFNESVQDIFGNAPTLSINDKVANIKSATEEDQLKLSREKFEAEKMERAIMEAKFYKISEF